METPSTQAFQAILERAIDLGVPDLAEQHDHYLYGGEKHGPPSEQLLADEALHLQVQLDALQADLADFEGQYGMTSDDFFRRYQAGQTDDRMDFVEWASLAQMANKLREHLRVLHTSQPELPDANAHEVPY
jgi:hypothetical protein